MKKNPTPEQHAAHEARKVKFRALIKQVAAMPEAERLELTQGAVVTVDGRSLSLCNTLMLVLQLGTPSVVGGFRQWLKAGRCVKKGEHGAMIWCPSSRRDAAPEHTVEGEPTGAEQADGESIRFIIGTVFDISQTQELSEQPAALAPSEELATVAA